MENYKFISCTYDGPVDEAGYPHGNGTMIYIADKSEDKDARDYKYVGAFKHGVRQGEGYICRDSYFPNPQSEYAWYSEGEYDGCGRLIHPKNRPGSYERYLSGWCIQWKGTWENDVPTVPKREFSDQYPDDENDRAVARATAWALMRDKNPHAGNTAIRLCHEPTDRDLTGHSKFGGKPDLPRGVDYPMMKKTDEDGESYEDPMFFVCQLRCEELASHDPNHLLPHSGMIYVFAEIDYFLGHLDADYPGMGQWDKQHFRVMHYDARACVHFDTHTVLRSDGVTPYGLPEERITFEEGADPNGDGMRLLGMPYIEDVREAMPGYVSLLQIEEVERWGLTFHDSGTLNFLIRREDLHKEKFDDVACYLFSF